MTERHRGDSAQVGKRHFIVAVVRRHRPRRAQQRELAAQSVGAKLRTERRCPLEHQVGNDQRIEARARLLEMAAHFRISFVPVRHERHRIAVERVAALDHVDARRDDRGRAHVDRETEAVEQLGPEFAFFGIAAANEHETRGMANAHPFTLDHVLAGGGRVEKQVDEMILQQVHFVDIQEAAMSAGQEAGLEGLFARRQRLLEVEGPNHAVFGRAQREIDDGHGRQHRFGVPTGLGAGATLVAARAVGLRVTPIATPRHHLHGGQEPSQRAHGRGLSGAAVAKDHDPTDRGIDGHQQQRQFHFILAYDGAERKNWSHAGSQGFVRWPHRGQSTVDDDRIRASWSQELYVLMCTLFLTLPFPLLIVGRDPSRACPDGPPGPGRGD